MVAVCRGSDARELSRESEAFSGRGEKVIPRDSGRRPRKSGDGWTTFAADMVWG